MSLPFYKPKMDGKGTSTTFSLKEEDNCVYLHMQKQHVPLIEGSYKECFAGGERISIKLLLAEIAQFIDTVEKNRLYIPLKHSNGNGGTEIHFKPYYDEADKQRGFVLWAKNKNGTWATGFKFRESELIKFYLKWCLNTLFAYDEFKSELMVVEEKKEEPKEDVIDL